MNRSADRLHQAQADLELAGVSAAAGHHEWACFACHQAVEKALKGLHLRHGQQVWGHGLGRSSSCCPSCSAMPSPPSPWPWALPPWPGGLANPAPCFRNCRAPGGGPASVAPDSAPPAPVGPLRPPGSATHGSVSNNLSAQLKRMQLLRDPETDGIPFRHPTVPTTGVRSACPSSSPGLGSQSGSSRAGIDV